MNPAKRSLLLLAALALPAWADRLPIPADAPPAFQSECGGCHLPFYAPAASASGNCR